MNRRGSLFWIALVVLLLVVGVVTGRGARTGPPLDPDSTDPLGTAALLALLDRYGVDVDRGLPADDTGTVLLLADRLGDDQRRQLDDWVHRGGTLVVTDPASPFAPVTDPFLPLLVSDSVSELSCSILPAGDGPRLDLFDLRLEGDTFLLFPTEPVAPDDGTLLDGGNGSDDGAAPFAPPPFTVAQRCFSADGGDHLQVTRWGWGRVIALGGAGAFTNRYLDEADNAVLAVDLLAAGGDPEPGSPASRLSVVYDPIVSPGTRTLLDLVPDGFVWMSIGLAVAFAVFVWGRARRFGRPVPEPQPVELPGSLLVRAAGELRRRSGGQAEAGAVLRADLAVRLQRSLRLPPDTPAPELAARVAAVAGLDPDLVARALAGPPATTGADLAALVVDIDRINAAVTRADRPDPVGGAGAGPPVPSSQPSGPAPIPVGAAGETT